jgi:hypothetical protein
MPLAKDFEILQAIEAAARVALQNAGLRRVNIRVSRAVGKLEIALDSADESELKEAQLHFKYAKIKKHLDPDALQA